MGVVTPNAPSAESWRLLPRFQKICRHLWASQHTRSTEKIKSINAIAKHERNTGRHCSADFAMRYHSEKANTLAGAVMSSRVLKVLRYATYRMHSWVITITNIVNSSLVFRCHQLRNPHACERSGDDSFPHAPPLTGPPQPQHTADVCMPPHTRPSRTTFTIKPDRYTLQAEQIPHLAICLLLAHEGIANARSVARHTRQTSSSPQPTKRRPHTGTNTRLFPQRFSHSKNSNPSKGKSGGKGQSSKSAKKAPKSSKHV